MLFTDRKEQVIDLKLTKFGEYLLSLGKLSFEYYSFFDDDVLYDSQYVGLNTERQNQIHDRIKDTAQLQAQPVFHGLETETILINKSIKINSKSENDIIGNLQLKKNQPTQEKNYTLSGPLGTISGDTLSAPALSINVLQGEISGTILIQTGSLPSTKIPLLTMKSITYKTLPMIDDNRISNNDNFGFGADFSVLTRKFEDGSFINIYEDSIILEIEEMNTLLENENFDIEVFKVDTETVGTNKREILTPLYFSNIKKPIIKNNLLLSNEEIQNQNFNKAQIDPNSVEYFFDVNVDDEIDENLLCNIAVNKRKDLLSDRIVVCEPSSVTVTKALYETDVTEADIDNC